MNNSDIKAKVSAASVRLHIVKRMRPKDDGERLPPPNGFDEDLDATESEQL